VFAAPASGPSASAVVSATSVAGAAGMNPSGTVRFVQHGESLKVSGRISGLRAGQEHGFHVHEAADCSGDPRRLDKPGSCSTERRCLASIPTMRGSNWSLMAAYMVCWLDLAHWYGVMSGVAVASLILWNDR